MTDKQLNDYAELRIELKENKMRLLFIDVMNNKNTTYKYKGVNVKVIGSIIGMFELDIENDSRPCFEEIKGFLDSAKIKV